VKTPLVITNPELIVDENSKNKYGLLLRVTDQTEISNDPRLAYKNNNKKVPFGQSEKTVWAKEEGLSRVYVGRGGVVSNGGVLAVSDDVGRVVIRDAKVAH